MLDAERYGDSTGAELAEHLAQCPACGHRRELAARLDGVMALDQNAAPRPGFDTRLFARLDEEKRRQARRKVWRWAWALLPVAAGLALAVVRFAPERPPPLPPEDLSLAMELELVEELDVLQQLDEVEAYDVLADVDEKELDAIIDEVTQ